MEFDFSGDNVFIVFKLFLIIFCDGLKCKILGDILVKFENMLVLLLLVFNDFKKLLKLLFLFYFIIVKYFSKILLFLIKRW